VSRAGFWRILGIDRTSDVKAIRRAYAEKLKAMDIDRDAAAYASLRNARDLALNWAKQEEARDQAAAEQADDPLPDDGADVLATAPPPPEGEDPYEDDPWEYEYQYRREIDRLPGDNSMPPAEPGPDIHLSRMLFPAGKHSEESLSDEEYEQASGYVRTLIEEAMASDINRQAAVENYFADLFMQSWPRSSMLVEPVAEAFGWEDRRGKLDEDYAISFLNTRLAGMRFYGKVTEPGHRLNKSWIELSTPGTKGLFGRFRVHPADVQLLLSGIRERFPELEAYLDREKVASWETREGLTAGSAWVGIVRVLFVIFVLAQIGRCVATLDRPGGLSGTPTAQEILDGKWTDEQRDSLALELFGNDMTYELVREDADVFEALERRTSFGSTAASRAFVTDELVEMVRTLTLTSAPAGDFEQIVAIKQLKLDLLRLARDGEGASACLTLMAGSRLPKGLTVPDELRDRERDQAFELLKAGILGSREIPEASKSASVPTDIVDAAQRKAGLGRVAREQALAGEGSDRDQCNFRIAMLEEVLRRPGTVSKELLLLL
jgi:hypothetical protein